MNPNIMRLLEQMGGGGGGAARRTPQGETILADK